MFSRFLHLWFFVLGSYKLTCHFFCFPGKQLLRFVHKCPSTYITQQKKHKVKNSSCVVPKKNMVLLMAEIPNNHLRWCWNPINNGISTTNLNWWFRQISGTHQQYVLKFPMSSPHVLGVLLLVFWDPQLHRKEKFVSRCPSTWRMGPISK